MYKYMNNQLAPPASQTTHFFAKCVVCEVQRVDRCVSPLATPAFIEQNFTTITPGQDKLYPDLQSRMGKGFIPSYR